jgi:hypothetical protein
LYTGNGSSQSITNAGSFQPGLLIQKSRSAATDNIVYDANRGANYLVTNTTAADVSSGIIALTATGFNVGSGTAVNANAATYVGWQWKAGGTAVSNTAGTITSQVSANTTSGFSVVTYTGTGANATVGHGLGVAPKMIIVKNRPSSVDNWQVYHASLTSAAYRMTLNTTNAQDSVPTMWNSTAPTSTVFSVGTQSGSNGSGNAMVAYCWSEVAGYSKFGSYTGNGSADGPFIYTGFRPKFVLIKISSGTADDWYLYDTSRNTYNVTNLVLFPDLSNAEATSTVSSVDILSNGFKIRGAGNGINTSGSTYIYACFAENPFKYALAR